MVLKVGGILRNMRQVQTQPKDLGMGMMGNMGIMSWLRQGEKK